jgi:capsular exopolysaccharide synthesis family protein
MKRAAGERAGATGTQAGTSEPTGQQPPANYPEASTTDPEALPWELDDVRPAARASDAGTERLAGARHRSATPAGAASPESERGEQENRLVRGAGASVPARHVLDIHGVRRIGPPPPPEPPALARYWDILRRRWHTALFVLLVVSSGVLAGVLLRTPVYRASGLLEIRPESTSAVPVETLFSSGKVASDDLETQYGILKSETLAERVLTQLAHYAPATATGQGAPSAPAAAVPTQDDVDDFREVLQVNPARGSRLVEVAFTSPDPKLSALTVNSVLDTYLQLRMEEAQRSAKWLEQQLQGAQERLEASERELQAYIRAHGLEVLETGKGETAQLANERLQVLHDALARAQAERMEKQSADEAARALAASRDVDSPVVQNLTVRLADLRREHAKLASVFQEGYPAVKALNDQIAELERALAEESRFVINRGQRDYRAALRKEALLRKALDEQNALVQALGEQSGAKPGYESLKRELVTNQEQFAALNQKLKDVSISAALKASNVGVVDRARPPMEPDGLPFKTMLALTLMVGLMVAAGGVFLREHFDTSMRTVADVETYLGVPTLGAIPSVGADLVPSRPERGMAGVRRQWRRIDDQGEQQSPLAEAFATLRNAVVLHEGVAGSRVLLITSAQGEEGKTTVSINLALSLARLKYRVLLIDANLRFPCVQRALGLPDRPGLVDYLAAGVDWRTSVHAEVQPNLDVLAGAEPQTSPADLLSLPRMARLLDAAAREYDFVVLDSPASLVHPADVHSLAALVDNVLFTVRQGWTPREVVSLALSQLDRVSGVVLNRSNSHDIGLYQQDLSPRPSPARS